MANDTLTSKRAQHKTPPKLQAFLLAKTDREILARARDAAAYYASYPHGANEYNYEMVSLLEIAAEEGKYDHVRVLLDSTVKDFNETEDHEIIRSFYRALESKQQQIALQLLNHIDIPDLAQIQLIKSNPLCSEFHGDYLAKISKTRHYTFCFNQYAVTGNIALIMAAALPDALMFNLLSSYPGLNNQLEASGIAAFLSATLDADGDVKKDINTEIAFQLLALPDVLLYALSQPHNFEALVNEFEKNFENGRSSTTSSLTTMESFSRASSGLDNRSPMSIFSTPDLVDSNTSRASSRFSSLSPGGVRSIRNTPQFFGPSTPRPVGRTDTPFTAISQTDSETSITPPPNHGI